MPASFTIDPERRLVLSRGWGVLVDDDLRGTQRGLRAAPEFAPDFRQLWDFTAVTQVRVTGEGLRGLALQSPFRRDARRAIVVASDVAFGMVRMYELVSDRDSRYFRIFRDVATAMQWLEREGDDPREGGEAAR